MHSLMSMMELDLGANLKPIHTKNLKKLKFQLNMNQLTLS
jgi:hypothetical protein